MCPENSYHCVQIVHLELNSPESHSFIILPFLSSNIFERSVGEIDRSLVDLIVAVVAVVVVHNHALESSCLVWAGLV